MREKGWRLGIVGALALAASAAAVHAQPLHEDRWGWNYCSPPYPPACVKTIEAGAGTAACGQEVNHFVASVAAYRACQTREIERAIFEANDVSDTFRCRIEKRCPRGKRTD